MSDNYIEGLLSVALKRLEILADPTDSRCGCDGLARKEIRLYLTSWVIPHIKAALALTLGEPTDDVRDLDLMARDTIGPRHPEDTQLHQDPFSELRVIDWARNAQAKVHEAKKCLDEATRHS